MTVKQEPVIPADTLSVSHKPPRRSPKKKERTYHPIKIEYEESIAALPKVVSVYLVQYVIMISCCILIVVNLIECPHEATMKEY